MAKKLPCFTEKQFPRRIDDNVMADWIVKCTAKAFGLASEDLSRKCRSEEISTVRFAAMFLIRKHTDLSNRKVSTRFGKSANMTTFAVQNVPIYMKSVRKFKEKFDRAELLIRVTSP